MAHNLVMVTLSCIIILSIIGGSFAVEYTVTNTAGNTPGGTRFNTVIGAQYTQQTLDAATTFIWTIFQQNNPSDRKTVHKVSLFVDNMEDVSYVSNNEIHVSASYIQSFSGDVKREMRGILYHEMTHIWQWNGNGQAPGGLIEGMADFVRLKAGYAPGHWVRPGQGDKWDQGYDVTAKFLDYCNELRSGTFVAELNKKMRDDYSDSFFMDLLGKSVNTLWADYKVRYNN